jgi:hypothetical protein
LLSDPDADQLMYELLDDELDELSRTGSGSAGRAPALIAPGNGSRVNTDLSLRVLVVPKKRVT